LSEVGQPIYAPFDGRVGVREGEKGGVDIAGSEHYAIIRYITPTEKIANAKGTIRVKKGEVIGYAKNIFPIYKKKKMKNHIHLEIYRYPNIKKSILWGPINPTPYIEPGFEKDE